MQYKVNGTDSSAPLTEIWSECPRAIGPNVNFSKERAEIKMGVRPRMDFQVENLFEMVRPSCRPYS